MIDFWPLFAVFVAGLVVGSNLGLVFHCLLQRAGHDALEGQLWEAECERWLLGEYIDAVCVELLGGY